jgi:hypothetical protein
MYVPPDGEMNAKIAKVKIFVDGAVWELFDYERQLKESSLTRGSLTSQVHRFYELWSAQIFVEPNTWQDLVNQGREKYLATVIEGFMKPIEQGKDPVVARSSLQGPLDEVRAAFPLAARSDSRDSRQLELNESEFVFPNGLPFADSR